MFPRQSETVNWAVLESDTTHRGEGGSNLQTNGGQVFIASLLLNRREGERCQRRFRLFLLDAKKAGQIALTLSVPQVHEVVG